MYRLKFICILWVWAKCNDCWQSSKLAPLFSFDNESFSCDGAIPNDFVTAFEPVGTQIEKQNKGHIVASLGELLNEEVPYTCFSSLKSYLDKNEDKLIKFTRAIIKALDYVNNSEIKDIIPYLKKDFSSSDDQELTKVITNYKSIEAWPKTMEFKENSFNKLIEIVKEANELDKDVIVPYETLVTDLIINKAKVEV